MIDVTRRSVEETAASIMNLIANTEDETTTSK
jgi:regulator of PEP synthase PpsR (kinase-PPPase family)